MTIRPTSPNHRGRRDEPLLSLLHRVRPLYPELERVSDEDARPLAEEWEEANRLENTTTFILASILSALSVGFLFWAVMAGFRWSLEHGLVLQALIKGIYLNSSTGYLRFAVFSFALGLIIYFLIIHWPFMNGIFLFFKGPVMGRERMRILNIRRSSLRFAIFTICANYLSVFLILTVALWSYPHSASLFDWLLGIWLWFGVTASAFLIPIALTVLLALVLSSSDEMFRCAPQAVVVHRLLRTLETLSAINAPYELTSKKRDRLIRDIVQSADQMARMYQPAGLLSDAGNWAVRRMRLASDSVFIVASWLAFPRSDTVTAAGQQLAIVTRSLIQGTYDNLPDRVLGEAQGLIRESQRTHAMRRIAPLVALFMMICAPLICYIFLLSRGLFLLHKESLPVLIVIFSAWVVMCVVIYIDRLPPDSRTTLLDIIKIVFKRGYIAVTAAELIIAPAERAQLYAASTAPALGIRW